MGMKQCYMKNRFELSSKIGHEILLASRNEMMVSMRFLDVALSTFTYEPDMQVGSIATNGQQILYNPMYLIRQYKQNRTIINELTMHMLVHSLFKHMFKASYYEPVFWNIATDIATSFTIDSISVQQLGNASKSERQVVYTKLQKSVKFMTAEQIYNHLKSRIINISEIAELVLLFRFDDHSIWYPESKRDSGANDNNLFRTTEEGARTSQSESEKSEGDSAPKNTNSDNASKSDSNRTLKNVSQPTKTGESNRNSAGDIKKSSSSFQSQAELSRHWENVAKKMQVDLETFSKEMGKNAGNLSEYIKIENRDRYDYGKFLKKFAIMREEITIDDEAFDYIAYTLGMNLNKNLPFIEPLEYKDVHKIQEFVIVIDTSASTSGNLIKNFLSKTYSILMSTESFFKRINVHIIQCDAKIQDDYKVTCPEDLHNYVDQYQVSGMGGTDFRPAFSYVGELLKKKEFFNLKGLIYFTDGYGTYPQDPTPYDTAFVFIRDDYSDVDVPGWAIKLILEPDDLK